MRLRYKISFLIGSLLIVCGCSVKKNTAFTRNYAAITTRYNIHFNGNEAYKQALTEFEKSYEDDFTDIIYMHPVSSLAGKETSSNPGLDRAIEKSQKSIKLKSIPKRPVANPRKMRNPAYKEYLKRKEYNPFLHNAWLLMAKSQFYKGDFIAANASFLYISRRFYWLDDVVNESKLWMSRCYTELGWLYEAENVLNLMQTDSLTGNNRKLHSAVYGNYLVRKGDYKSAIPYLEAAAKNERNKQQKARIRFLVAQLYAETGDYKKAYDGYGSIAGMNISYRKIFNASIKQTEVMPASNYRKIEKKLNTLVKDSRNKEYLDQVHYAKGNLYLHLNDSVRAISEYQTAVDKSTRGGIEKAVAAVKLGDLTFARGEYLKAQPAYSAAVSILPKTHKDYERVELLSDVLDKLKTHAETVHLQDSLLTLVAMPEDKRMAAIQLVIDELIKKEKELEEEQRREEYESQKGDFVNPNDKNTSPAPTLNKDNSWYFYNQTAITTGKGEFQKKWGARKPEDDWRRRDKTEVFYDNSTENQDTEEINDDQAASESVASESPEQKEEINDPKNPQYYLRQLPFSKEEQASANEMILEGLYNMGGIFNQELNNLPLAISTFEELDGRYPDNGHKLDIYYEIYLMYMRLENIGRADYYKNRITSLFPASGYAQALSDPQYIENLKNMSRKQNELYETTYKDYLAGNFRQVHSSYEFVRGNWPLSELMPKFMFLHALSLLSEGNNDGFRTVLEQITSNHGESDVAPLSGQMIKGLTEGRSLIAGESHMAGMIWETRLSLDQAMELNGPDGNGETFSTDRDAAHLLVLVFQTDSVNVNDLLFNMAKYNFTNYLIKDFDLEVITFDELSMLVIKGFDNFDELSRYRLKFSRSGAFVPDNVTPVMISDSNFRLLLKGKSFGDYFKFVEEQGINSVENDFFDTNSN